MATLTSRTDPPVPVKPVTTITLEMSPAEAAALLVVSERIGGEGPARRFFSPFLSDKLEKIPEVVALVGTLHTDPAFDAIYFLA